MPYTAVFEPSSLSRAEVDAIAGSLVLEFGTNWCGWCQGAQPLIQSAFEAAGANVRHVKIEDGRGRPLGRSFGVKLWPTLVFMKDGREVARFVRPQAADTAQLVQALKQVAT